MNLGLDSDILWDGRWISFLDAVLQMILLGNPDAFQALPVTLGTISIDPTVHPAPPEEESEAESKNCRVFHSTLGCVGVGVVVVVWDDQH